MFARETRLTSPFRRTSFSGSLLTFLLVLGNTASVYADTLQELQADFLGMRFGLFLHYNMSTYTDEEWASETTSPDVFNPGSTLDCGQWADAAVSAGMDYMVLTVKHHDGFCLWNSGFTTHDVGSSGWRSGGGDVVQEFVDAARSRNLGIGLYYSIWDKKNGEDVSFIKNQLTEILTNYGAITLLWFDAWGAPPVGFDQVPYTEIRDHIKSIQPNCLVLANNQEFNLNHSEIVLYWQAGNGLPAPDNTLPAEAHGTIRADGKWFYHAAGNCNLRSVEDLRGYRQACNSKVANYLLDVTPNQLGLIPNCQVQLLNQLGEVSSNTDNWKQYR